MTRQFHIFPIGRQDAAQGVRHTCRYERHDGHQVIDKGESWFEFEDWPLGLSEDDSGAFLINCLPFAMEERRDLHLHGAVAHSLAANLAEFRDYWATVKPERFHRIEISADVLTDDSQAVPLPGTIALFSGGVDAAHTVWRHLNNHAGAGSRSLKFGVFIDGFERASITDRPHFANAYKLCREMLATIDLPLIRVRQNWRQVQTPKFHADSKQVFASCLASCLYPFKGSGGTALVASGHQYGHPRFHLVGSNPVADRFLTCNNFQFRHDDAGTTRMEKVAELVAWPAFFDLARVCWHPRPDGTNCGACEKCLRTMFALLIVHGELPAVFPQNRDDMIAALARTEVKLGARCYWQEMLDWAHQHDRGREWWPYIEAKTRKPWKERRKELKALLRECLP